MSHIIKIMCGEWTITCSTQDYIKALLQFGDKALIERYHSCNITRDNMVYLLMFSRVIFERMGSPTDVIFDHTLF